MKQLKNMCESVNRTTEEKIIMLEFYGLLESNGTTEEYMGEPYWAS